MVEVEGGTLTAVAGFDGHQGIALVVEPRAYAGIADVLARAVERGEAPFILVLDSLEDPQNVGTLLRSAEAAGVHGVLFPTHRQAPLTPAAIKASAGAVEHLLLCPVDDLPGALSDLRIRGLRIAAAEADAPLTTAQADLRGPLAIVVGSEGQGLSPVVRRRADVAVRIPMRGAIGSLNAAVAGSILLFAAVAQRDVGETDGPDRPRPVTFDELADASSAAVPARPQPRSEANEPTESVTAAADTESEVEVDGLVRSVSESEPPRKRARTARATASADASAESMMPTAAATAAPPPARTTRRAATSNDRGEGTPPAVPPTDPRPVTQAGAQAGRSKDEPAARPRVDRPGAGRVRAKARPASGDSATSATDPAIDDLLPGGPPAE